MFRLAGARGYTIIRGGGCELFHMAPPAGSLHVLCLSPFAQASGDKYLLHPRPPQSPPFPQFLSSLSMPVYYLQDCHYFYRTALRGLNVSTTISPLYA